MEKEEILLGMDRFQLFSLLLKKLTDGTRIVFTDKNISSGDRFLLFGSWRKEIICTFKRRSDGVWKVLFDCDEPILLENCPETFFRSILLNI